MTFLYRNSEASLRATQALLRGLQLGRRRMAENKFCLHLRFQSFGGTTLYTFSEVLVAFLQGSPIILNWVAVRIAEFVYFCCPPPDLPLSETVTTSVFIFTGSALSP